MKYAVAFFFFALVLAFGGARTGGAGYLLCWPALSFGLVGVAYAGSTPGVFGKRRDGTLHPLSTVLLLPYLLYAWILWHAWRLVTREPAFHTLTDGVTIGRRLLASEYPDGISTVIDLTCEFPEPRAVRESRTYRSLPVLDAGRPALAALRGLVEEIRRSDEGVYIHCANGHGRTGTVAGALLPTAGKVESGREAREFILGRRPGAHLNAGQQLFLEAFAEALRGDGRTAS